METVWKITLFGGLRAIPADGGEAVARFRTRRAAALLAVLAFRIGGTPPTRDELIEILWPYAEPAAALARLAVELSGLRKRLEPAEPGEAAVFRTDRFTISLDPRFVTTDVSDFEVRLRRARTASSHEEQIAYLTEAIDTYSGPLLPQMEGEWIEPERERLAGRFVDAVVEVVNASIERGDANAVIELAGHAVKRERMRKSLYVPLMRSKIAANRPADALQSFDELRRMLRETTGSEEPGADAQRLAAEARDLLAAGAAPPSKSLARTSGARASNAPKPLPLGTLTLLATDIEGSTPLGQSLGEDVFARLLERHHALLRAEFVRAGGTEFKEAGDGFWVAFDAAQAALRCARACQQVLAQGISIREAGRSGGKVTHSIRIRVAIHVADLRYVDSGKEAPVDLANGYPTDDDAATAAVGGSYRGLALHDLARLLSATNGRQIFLSEAAEAVLRRDLPDGMAILNRGRYRLRDAPAPVHVYEATWEESADYSVSQLPNAPPMRTPTGLPAQFTRFFGRDSEIAAISDALNGERGTRLLTLTGLGGSGKTRLAAETARAVSGVFDGAVWFVNLVDTDDPGRIIDAVRAVVAPEAPGDSWEALGSIFGADPSLLVLDNLEHLLGESVLSDAGATEFLQTFLNRFPTVCCLVTSRQRVGIGAEQEIAVRPLPIPVADQSKAVLSATAARQFAGVALFEDRAKRARFDFDVTDANAGAVAALCERLEGIPLGLELAAAWVRLLTPAEMLTQFDEIGRSRDRSLPDRHRSLDAAIEGSYRLLDEEQRSFFRRLSVFRGGWTLAAAKAVCDEPMALALLAELRDRSLIVVEVRGDSSRYRFLETVRTFAAGRLAVETADRDDSLRRYVAFFAALAAEANDALQGADQAAWLARLAAEHQNITATLDRADRAPRLRMAGHLHRYWMVRGYLQEARSFLRDVLAGDDSQIETADLNKAINVAGTLAFMAGDLTDAKPLLATAAERYRAAGDERGAGAATINLGIVADMQGNFEDARVAYESTLELWRRLDRRKTLATVLSNLGVAVRSLGDLVSARRYLEESLELQAEQDDSLLRAHTLQNLATVAESQNDFTAATWFIAESLRLRIVLADDRGTVSVVQIIASIQLRIGRLDRAALLYGAMESALALTGVKLLASVRQSADTDMTTILTSEDILDANAIWKKGRALQWEQIISTALETVRV